MYQQLTERFTLFGHDWDKNDVVFPCAQQNNEMFRVGYGHDPHFRDFFRRKLPVDHLLFSCAVNHVVGATNDRMFPDTRVQDALLNHEKRMVPVHASCNSLWDG
jgi:hypothetical protein